MFFYFFWRYVGTQINRENMYIYFQSLLYSVQIFPFKCFLAMKQKNCFRQELCKHTYCFAWLPKADRSRTQSAGITPIICLKFMPGHLFLLSKLIGTKEVLDISLFRLEMTMTTLVNSCNDFGSFALMTLTNLIILTTLMNLMTLTILMVLILTILMTDDFDN